jgi:hypothetical protein
LRQLFVLKQNRPTKPQKSGSGGAHLGFGTLELSLNFILQSTVKKFSKSKIYIPISVHFRPFLAVFTLKSRLGGIMIQTNFTTHIHKKLSMLLPQIL